MTSALRGILLMAISIAVFSVLDTYAKFTMQTLPVAVFFRYFFALMLSAVLLLRQGGPSLFVTRNPGL